LFGIDVVIVGADAVGDVLVGMLVEKLLEWVVVGVLVEALVDVIP